MREGACLWRLLLRFAPALVLVAAHVPALARNLTFEERVAAQAAIERVYHTHRTGATAPFEVALPRPLLEQKVRTVLKQSVALEKFWNTPLTAEMLQGEMERMARASRMPERLAELESALGDDRFLIQEVLARQVLADRLARSFFETNGQKAFDAQGNPRTYDEWWEEVRLQLDPGLAMPVADAAAPWPSTSSSPADGVCVGDVWAEGSVLNGLPDGRTGHTALWTGSEMLVWGGKGTQTGMRYDPATDVWTPMSTTSAPEARFAHVAVWTGSQMIVWGGKTNPNQIPGSSCCINNGGLGCDDNACESLICEMDSFCCNVAWDSICGELAATYCAICGGSLPLGTGGRYDPVSDSWLPTSTVDAPSARFGHTAVWTGNLMIVWGGGTLGNPSGEGALYDPVSDTWTSTATVDAPAARSGHTAVWTGDRMVVWGGTSLDGAENTGGRYDPLTNSWSPMSTEDAPVPRVGHTAIWNGELMLVWGGKTSNSTKLHTGGRYDPLTDTWAPMTTVGVPGGRSDHSAVWTESDMIVWGGVAAAGKTNTGGRYDPVADSWSPTTVIGAPPARYNQTAVWTGARMVVWGGTTTGNNALDTGGRYDPVANSWLPTAFAGAPAGRFDHTAVWTGSEMIVWGGVQWFGDYSDEVKSGGRYDPATDSWKGLTGIDAPSARKFHTAVWTGSHLIVWGGSGDTGETLATGGRYDPVADSWSPTKNIGSPQPRSGHSAVWTGSQMVVWGGSGLATGGRYDPVADTWSATSMTDAPPGRSGHTAVWAGDEMIVWGGGGTGVGNTGGRYDPVADSWSATSTSGAPDARSGHTAVWTGTRMIVWGGGSPGLNTGGRYDPAGDSWSATSTAGAPDGRNHHTAVWTGAEMIVWGGFDLGGDAQDSGGRYSETTDSWTPTSTVGAPSARADHTAVWEGNSMIVWGGAKNGYTMFDTGGRYFPDGDGADADGDGHVCAADCDDADAGSFAPPGEVSGLRIRADKKTLQWNTAAAGIGTAYDVARGLLSELPVGAGASETCIASGLAPGPGFFVAFPDPESPGAGSGFWYLVRAANGCGVGTYGLESGGAERLTKACP